jgi:Na+-transporting methylmalonyl-CoA/oxaloacetate decarboxylase gamma subunit
MRFTISATRRNSIQALQEAATGVVVGLVFVVIIVFLVVVVVGYSSQ